MEYLVTPPAEHLSLDAARLREHPDGGRRFPDGEVYVRLPRLEEEVVVVHAGQPAPNEGLAYLYGALAALGEREHTVRLVFSYTPYCRQDRAFEEGTLNFARALMRDVAGCAERVYAVDPHFAHREWVEGVPVERIRALPALRGAVDMDEYAVVGPDLGAAERFGLRGFRKDRGGSGVSLTGELDVAGENVLVFDDVIATGGTMVAARDRLEEQGAATVQAAAVHGVLGEGVERVREAFDRLYLTNSIADRGGEVWVEPLIRAGVEAGE